jgi:uncharacterized membrane protein (Fun14 family)
MDKIKVILILIGVVVVGLGVLATIGILYSLLQLL